ncbi:hypothetical protein [Pantoea sp. BAV 3049]|uniref:hypothetical protein n=1 Tax=Pantoea sp. BAV 3049 TaxID=2654188 RepID=UPI00131CF6C1|nr:hypothetical protein [Pantoea sp. BAV 3049]
MENGFSIVMTPAQLAAMMEGETGCPAVGNANEKTQQSGNSEMDSLDKIEIVLKAGILKQRSQFLRLGGDRRESHLMSFNTH